MDRKITIRLDNNMYDTIEKNARILGKNKSETTRLMLEMFINSKVFVDNNKIIWHGSRPIN